MKLLGAVESHCYPSIHHPSQTWSNENGMNSAKFIVYSLFVLIMLSELLPRSGGLRKPKIVWITVPVSRPQCCTEWTVSFRFYIVFFQFQLKLCNSNRTILNYLKIQWLWYCNMNCSIQSVSRPYLRHLFVHVSDFTVHPKNTRSLLMRFRRNGIMKFCQRFGVCVLDDEISCEESGNTFLRNFGKSILP